MDYESRRLRLLRVPFTISRPINPPGKSPNIVLRSSLFVQPTTSTPKRWTVRLYRTLHRGANSIPRRAVRLSPPVAESADVQIPRSAIIIITRLKVWPVIERAPRLTCRPAYLDPRNTRRPILPHQGQESKEKASHASTNGSQQSHRHQGWMTRYINECHR